MNGAVDLNALARAIADNLSKRPPLDDVLWDSQECADYLRKSRRHFVERVATHHRFPKPVKIPTEQGRSQSCWYAGEVIAWVKTYR